MPTLEPTDTEVRNYTKAMQKIDALMGLPIRLTTTPEEYRAQRDELAELLETRLSVYS